jgi:tRNA threonylcarbamoyladenosine biosynthesis protein TsaB
VLILAVDTSSPAGSLAVLKGTRTIGTVAAWTAELYSTRMFRQLEFLLNELSLTMEDFDLLTVATGPGSFTGLRVGLTAVKGWAEVHGKPIAAVSTLEAVATQSHSSAKHLVSVLDARRGQIYFAAYQRAGSSGKQPLVLEGNEQVGAPRELLDQLESRFDRKELAIVTPVPELFERSLSRCETSHGAPGKVAFRIEEVSATLAPHVGRIGLRHSEQGKLTDSLKLDANYIRPSDAEVHWRLPTGS